MKQRPKVVHSTKRISHLAKRHSNDDIDNFLFNRKCDGDIVVVQAYNDVAKELGVSYNCVRNVIELHHRYIKELVDSCNYSGYESYVIRIPKLGRIIPNYNSMIRSNLALNIRYGNILKHIKNNNECK